VIVFDTVPLDDPDRIFKLVAERDPSAALDHMEKIRGAVSMLGEHPEIGRSTARGSSLRELVISHGKTRDFAVYEHSPAERQSRVAAIRHQREVGYRIPERVIHHARKFKSKNTSPGGVGPDSVRQAGTSNACSHAGLFHFRRCSAGVMRS
jgi:plasmid stabilization system protein ParE